MTETYTSPAPHRRPTFAITSTLLLVIGFAQLVAIGVAIAVRSGETREIITYVKGDPLIVTVPTLPDEPPTIPLDASDIKPADIANNYADKSAVARATHALHVPAVPGKQHSDNQLSAHTPSFLPPISNPKVEGLVHDAAAVQMKGDLIAALLKLDEAESIDPKEPAIYYNKAVVFEDMGNWEKAADHYEKLYNMGTQAGVYFHRAALKLSQGINPESSKQGLVILGNIATRIDPSRLHAKLTIPVRISLDQEFDPNLLEVQVHYYDIVDGKRIERVPHSRQDNISNRWLSLPADWKDGIEELIESTYSLPPVQQAEAHIFGDRKFFGYVAELYYKGELLDQQASPRRLHALHGQKNSPTDVLPPLDNNLPSEDSFPIEDTLPVEEPLPNLHPDNLLLPPLPRK